MRFLINDVYSMKEKFYRNQCFSNNKKEFSTTLLTINFAFIYNYYCIYLQYIYVFVVVFVFFIISNFFFFPVLFYLLYLLRVAYYIYYNPFISTCPELYVVQSEQTRVSHVAHLKISKSEFDSCCLFYFSLSL